MSALLTLDRVSKSFGAGKAVDGVSLALAEGEALGILGPNGAGKTTLFDLIGGDTAPDSGRVLLRGQDITHMRPHERCRAGIGRAYQIPHPFSGMTVLENLLAAAVFGGGLSEEAAYPVCVGILENTGLDKRANTLAGALGLLDRKRLELARALATGARVLLLDEIAGGLTDHEAVALTLVIQAARRQGIAIIWIEHVVHALIACVSRLIVLNSGQLLAEGEPRSVITSDVVRRVYMGIEA